jgi:hypothetical protein
MDDKPMKSFPPLLIVAGLFAAVLALPAGLYLLLTRRLSSIF